MSRNGFPDIRCTFDGIVNSFVNHRYRGAIDVETIDRVTTGKSCLEGIVEDIGTLNRNGFAVVLIFGVMADVHKRVDDVGFLYNEAELIDGIHAVPSG